MKTIVSLARFALAACVLLTPPILRAADERLPEAAQKNLTEQIRALNREKQARTPAQKKMDSHLVHAAKEKRKEPIAPGVPKLKSGVHLDENGLVQVDIEATVSKVLLNLIEKKGGKIVNSFAEYNAIRAWIPVDELEFFAARPDVKMIRTALEPETHAISEGDRTHRADYVKSFKNVFGSSTKITGQGVKVGVLSDSVDYLSNAQSSNTKGRGADLGPVTIITDGSGKSQHGRPGTGEGTAMLEIVYDLAPGAQLFFATGNGGKANMANNIRRLRNVYGCDIIIDDLTYADEPPFQDDVLSQAVYDVSDSGALYFSSAANSGNQNDGTSATWEGDFNGANFIPGVGTFHQWSGTNTMNRFSNSRTNPTTISLFWSDKFSASANDYDLYIYDNAGNVLGSSTFAQNGSEDPYEWVAGVGNGMNIAVLMVNAQNRYLHLDAGRGRLQFGTSGDTRGHNASVAGNAFSVAASPISRSPAPGYFIGGTNNPVETFSSDGLRLRFYDRYTNAYTPGNFSSTGGFAFQKPDITAADGVSNSGVYPSSVNLSPFFGTSAAAPHAGAIAALLKSYNTNLSDVQIRQCLLLTALDIEAPGNDRDSGFGLIRADLALAMAQPTIFRSVTNLSFSVSQGAGNPAPQTFTIKNTGFTKLNWSVASNQPWLSATPNSGDATKGIDSDVVTVSVDVSSLSLGTHFGTLTISDPQASNNGETIFVFLTISDTTDPTLRITSPLDNSSHQNPPILSGVASDGGGSGILNNRVEFTLYTDGLFWTGTQWKSNTDAQDPAVLLFAPIVNGVWNYTNMPSGPNSRVGTYYVSSYVRDLSGNLSPPEPGITSISFKVDRDPPQVAITAPLDHAVITNSVFPGLAGTASDSIGLIGVKVYLYRYSDGQFWDGTAWGGGGSAILPVAIYGDGHWNSTSPLPVLGGANPNTAFSNGDYNLIAIAFDAAGNEQRADSVFTVDFHPVYTWTAGSFSDGNPNNNNNLWDNPANWDLGQVPISSATVVIGGGDPDNREMSSVQLYGLKLNGGTLHAGNMTIKNLTVSGGRFDAATIQLDDNGVFTWSGGELNPGTYNIPTTGVLYITNSANKSIYESVLNNSGTVIWSGGNIYGHHSRIENGPTGLFDARANATLNLYPNFGDGNRVFVNRGTFRKSTSVETWHQGSFTNYGTIEVQDGTLSFYDYMSWENGSTISGAGTARGINGCCGFYATLDGTLNLAGTFDLSEGSTFLRGTGNLYLTSNGVLKISAGYVGGNINISGGTVAWTGGGFDGTNTLNTTVNITGNGTKYLNRASNNGDVVLNNAGSINWSGDGKIYQWARANYGEKIPVFNNLSNAVFRVLTGGTPFWRDGSYPIFNNEPGALFVKSGETNETFINASMFNNRGEIRADNGILTFDDLLNLDTNSVINANSLVRFNGGIVSSSDVNVSGTVQMLGGTFTGASSNGVALGRWKGNHVFQWHGGTIGGRVILETNVVMEVSAPTTSPVTKYLASDTTLDNFGTIKWFDRGPIYSWARANYGEFPSTLNNRGGAVFRAEEGGRIFWRDGNYSTFNNFAGAQFVKTGGSTNTLLDGFTINNFGEVRSETNVIEFDDVLNLLHGSKLTGAGSHLISAGTHQSIGTDVIDGTRLKMTGGTLVGNVSAIATTNSGLFEWSGGVIASNLTLEAGSTAHISSGATKQFGSGAVFNNKGYVRWLDTGTIYNYGRSNYGETPATWNNLSGSTFDIWADGVMSFEGSPSVFNNQSGAVFRKTGGSTNVVYWTFNNYGVVQSYLGQIQLAGGGFANGTFFAETGAGIQFIGGTYTLADAQLTGSGTFKVNGGTVTATGNLSFLAGTPSLEILNGTLNGSASFVGAPLLNWTGGSLSGTQYIAPGSVFNITGSNRKYLLSATKIENAGTINWTGPGDIYAWARGGYAELPSTINNLSNGVFRLLTDGTPFVRDGEFSTFNNLAGGTLIKSGGTNETYLNGFIFHNNGNVTCSTGMLSFVENANFHTGTVLTATSPIRFAGNITVDGPVFATGTTLLNGGSFNALTSSNAPLSSWNGTNTFDWTAGTLAGNWTFNSNVVVTVRDATSATSKYLSGGTVINNNARIDWSGAGAIYAMARAGYNELPSTINNKGAFRFLNGGTPFVRDGSYCYFNNLPTGVLTKTGDTNELFYNSFILNNNGAIVADAGTLTFNDYLNLGSNSVIAANSLVRFAGNITVSNSVTATGTITMDAGTFVGASGTNGLALGTWNGNHNFNWLGGYFGGHLVFGNDAILNVGKSGSAAAKNLSGGTVLDNFGTMNWTGPGTIYGFARGGYNEQPSTINNFARMNLLSDGVAFTRDGDYSIFNNHFGAVLAKTGGTNSSLINSFVLKNSGELRADIGTLEYNDASELNDAGVFSGAGNHLVSGGNHFLRGASTISGTKLKLSGGTLTGSTNSLQTASGGIFEWNGGTIAGDFAFASGAHIEVTGTATKSLGSNAILRNRGTVTWSGSGSIFSDGQSGYGNSPATINNESGAQFLVVNDSSFSMNGTPSTFNNQSGAVFRKSSSAGTTTCNWFFNNNGILDLQSGTLALANSHTLGASGAVTFAISGLTGVPKLSLAGNTTLNGALNFVPVNGFLPADGNQFTLVNYGSRNGEFTPLALPSLSTDLRWKATYNSSVLVIAVEKAHSISSFSKLANGQFQMNFSGPGGGSAVLQASTDLINWTSLVTNSPFTGNFLFSDSPAPSVTNQFYRVIVLP